MSGEPLVATASQTVGPFFHFGLTPKPNGRLVERLAGGDPISLVIRVTDGDGRPVDDGAVEIMQEGVFGRMATGPDGTCVFETVRPRRTPSDPADVAPHIHVCLFARGLLRHLHTRIYFPGEPALDDDQVIARVPDGRRQTLFAAADAADDTRWTFDLRLQGDGETVFFDG